MKITVSEEEIKTMIELYQSGESIMNIALKLDRAIQTVTNNLLKHGVKLRERKKLDFNGYTPSEINDYILSHTIKEAEEYFDCDYNSIYYFLKKNGFSGTKSSIRLINVVDKEEFCEYYSSHSNYEVAEHYGVSVAQVYRVAAKFGAKKERSKNYHKVRIHNQIVPENFREKQKEMVKYLACKYSGEDIAVFLNKTPARICQILKEE